jgi:hypothetical protein
MDAGRVLKKKPHPRDALIAAALREFAARDPAADPGQVVRIGFRNPAGEIYRYAQLANRDELAQLAGRLQVLGVGSDAEQPVLVELPPSTRPPARR